MGAGQTARRHPRVRRNLPAQSASYAGWAARVIRIIETTTTPDGILVSSTQISASRGGTLEEAGSKALRKARVCMIKGSNLPRFWCPPPVLKDYFN